MAARRLLGRISSAYSRSLELYPYTTQGVTSGVLWGLGDCVAQLVEEGPHDWRRTAITAAYGGVLIGPAGHAWYVSLDRWVARHFVEKSFGFVASKVVADTCVFGPLHVGGYFAAMAVGEGSGYVEFERKMRKDFIPTLAADVAIWPWIQSVNFRFVPLSHQLLYVNSFVIVDSAFMSWCCATEGWFDKLVDSGKGFLPGSVRARLSGDCSAEEAIASE